ncbi:hypothetical protein Agabi119p4_10958 [Agaricus bisporus var. burnettii]|uniref:Acid phosphatase n=1 Tax=Agaricus bisporus var. burnettii TaxID=192524 RepID=A0A8H7C0U1_AGABI|nr:hypothetical protein Agabi119p4_10958 [Agaricus bisporus var. burnettii]
MRSISPLWVLLGIAVSFTEAVNVVYYPPDQTHINNLTNVLHSTEAPGIFNSSHTPDSIYGIYNWCNMPHVRTKEYKTPSSQYKLVYVEAIQRHQKRTPYASNTYFEEVIGWDCVNQGRTVGLHSTSFQETTVEWQAEFPSNNPFTKTVGPGFINSTCIFPGITSEGQDDARVHGEDLREVYFKRLGLGETYDGKTARVRVTNNVITSEVASGSCRGLWPKTDVVPVSIEEPVIDSLEPSYPCPNADAIRNNYTTGDGGAVWLNHLTAAAPLFDKLDSISGIEKNDTGGWHISLDHNYDNLSAKQCHGKPLSCDRNDTSTCVSQEEANMVYNFGNWEYSYIFRDAPESADYSCKKYGAFFLQLQDHLQQVMDGKSTMKFMYNIAHDGSMAPMLGCLQISQMVWPGMGAEVTYELYEGPSNGNNGPGQCNSDITSRDDNSHGNDNHGDDNHGNNGHGNNGHGNSGNGKQQYYLRVMWGGKPMKTSTPMGTLDLIPVETFFDYIAQYVGTGEELVQLCQSA